MAATSAATSPALKQIKGIYLYFDLTCIQAELLMSQPLVTVMLYVHMFQRTFHPPEVKHDHLYIVSVAGLIVNIIGIVALHYSHSHGQKGINNRDYLALALSSWNCRQLW